MTIPDYWDENKSSKCWDNATLVSVIKTCESEIKKYSRILKRSEERLDELKNATYKYKIRVMYMEEYQSDYYTYGGYYLSSVIKIPILGDVVGDFKFIEELKSTTYERALKDVSELYFKYKQFKPTVDDCVPQIYKHTPGDL